MIGEQKRCQTGIPDIRALKKSSFHKESWAFLHIYGRIKIRKTEGDYRLRENDQMRISMSRIRESI